MSNNKHIKKCLQDGFTRVAGCLSPVFVHQARRFRRDETGTIAIIFALSVVMIVGLVGGAVDYGRWINAKSKQQAALDSAVLAAGRAYQVTYGNTATALNTANQYYSRLKSHWLFQRTIQPFRSPRRGRLSAAYPMALYPRPFLQWQACRNCRSTLRRRRRWRPVGTRIRVLRFRSCWT